MIEEILSEYTQRARGGRISGYSVDYTKHELRLGTEKSGERTEMLFVGLLAHQFNNAVRDNILYDVAQVTLDGFIADEGRRLKKSLRFGFPAPVGQSVSGLKRKLREKGYKIFEIRASIGLYGYVIAKGLKVGGDTE